MELETLEALYRYFPSDDRKAFMEYGFRVLQDCFRIKGFRKSTWWHNITNRQMMAQFFETHPSAYRKIIVERTFTDLLKQERDFPKKCHLWSDYYHLEFGAPEFTADEIKADFSTAIITKPFDAWLKDYTEHHEIGEAIRKYYPANLFWLHVHNVMSQANTLTFEEVCERVWKRVGAQYQCLLKPADFVAAFPLPESLKEEFTSRGEKAPVAKTVPAPAEAEKSQTDTASDENPDESTQAKEPCSLEELQTLAMRFKEDRSPDSAQPLLDALVDHDYHACVTEYFCQTTFIVDLENQEEAEHVYLLALLKSEGATQRFDREFSKFRKSFPKSEYIEEVKSQRDAFNTRTARDNFFRTKFYRTWATENNFGGKSYKERLKLLKTGLMALMQTNKIQALEVASESLQAEKWEKDDRISLLQMLSQILMSLKLTAPAVLVVRNIMDLTNAANVRADAWERLASCLIADKRWTEVDAEVAKMEEQHFDEFRLNSIRQKLSATKEGTAIKSPESVKPDESETVLPQRYTGTDRPPLENLPYPRRYIGLIGRMSRHINWAPKYIETTQGWVALTRDEQAYLCPRKGWLSLRFSNPSAASALKAGRLVVLEVTADDVKPSTDVDYTKYLEPQVGKQIQFLSSAGALVVKPCERDVELTYDTFVSVSNHPQDNQVFEGEDALLETKEGLLGPFKLRMDMAHRLYIPKVSVTEAAAVPCLRPKYADSLLTVQADSPDTSVTCTLALLGDDAAFEKSTVDKVTDAALMQLVSRKIPEMPAILHTPDLLKVSDILSEPAHQKRVIELLTRLETTGKFAVQVHSTAVRSVLRELKAEENLEKRPLTEVVLECVESSSELKKTMKRLEEKKQSLLEQKQHEIDLLQNIADEKEKELKARAAELVEERKKLDEEGAARKAFWDNEIKTIIDSAKTEIARFKALPELNLGSAVSHAELRSDKPKTSGVDYQRRALTLWEAPTLTGSTSDVRRKLIEAFRSRRGYTQDETINLFISVAQNFLTVFSGEPGSGKTSVCGLIADSLGLRSPVTGETALGWNKPSECTRFLTVPVERGWTSKRDFLGYFNPLTQSFSASDKRRYDAFRQLDYEAEAKGRASLPFVFLLDEANLSPMEYYWADFMRICGGDDAGDKEIVLGDNLICRIPEHLRFLATINIDDTTEPLSPRLLDRAWIVRLPDPNFSAAAQTPVNYGPVLWKDFVSAFGGGDRAPEPGEFKAFFDVFHELGMNVSMRSRRAMARFVAVGATLFSGKRVTAVDYAVAQKLLPMIRGSGPAFREKLTVLQALCRNYPVSEAIVKQILLRGDQNLNFYQYF